MSAPAPGTVVARLRQALAAPRRRSRARRRAAALASSLTTRRYLLGTVLAWVLVVYLATSPALNGGLAAPAGPGTHGGAATGPLAVSPPAPSLSAEGSLLPGVPGFGGLGPFTFNPPPAPPPAPQLSCPYPIPQSQTSPFGAGAFLSFEGPFLDLSGPFAAYDIPTLGAISPLVPLLSPLVSISEPVMNEVTPNLSVVAGDVVALEQAAGLDSPQEQQYAQEFEPYWLQLVSSLTPAEAALASTTGAQCLELFENELAVMAAQENLQLPPLPVLPAGIAPGTSSSTDAVARATAADTRAPLAQIVLPWSGGVPAAAVAAVAGMRAKGTPALVELVDAPPPGAAMGGTGFADFVATAVRAMAGATAFEMAVPGPDPSAPVEMADLVHGLAAADFVRMPGQLIGVSLAAAATGEGGPAFWRAFAGAMEGYQPNMVDFVAAGLTPVPEPSVAAAVAEAAGTARALEGQWAALGGVPADVPLFATVSLVGPGPLGVAAVQQQLSAYLAALGRLHVGVLAPLPPG